MLLVALTISQAPAQIAVQSKYIKALVGKNDGLITVLPLYDRSSGKGFQGRLGLDPQLDFYEKSFFTCQIGSNYFTNNGVIPVFPSTARHLNSDGVTSIISDVTAASTKCDTVRTIWSNKNGVDIIQDVYCIDFYLSAQVVYKWSFLNNTGTAVSIGVQYLQDMQISDPTSAQAPNSNDGPKVLTKWEYTNKWAQYPSITYPSLPWFYIGFLYDLPNTPSLNPGLSAMGILDYGAPLNLSKPSRITNGDWYALASNIWSTVNPPLGTGAGTDNGVLIEFNPKSVPAGKKVEVARSSYGTGEYEKCVGNLFSLVFYPHHLKWTRTPGGGFYSPSVMHIEKFVVNPSLASSSSNTKVTLKVGPHLDLTNDSCKTTVGKTQIQPPPPSTGTFIGPSGVGYFDWYACPSPAQFCTGSSFDTLQFTATCGVCPPAFVNQYGVDLGFDKCDMSVEIDCAELDIDAPRWDTVLNACHSSTLHVYDSRSTDRGLQSITWKAKPGTDTNKVKVIGPIPPIGACYTDKAIHTITISKPNPNDSTANGYYDFTFTDCLGHVSTMTLGVPTCVEVSHPDSLPPVYTLVKRYGTFDSTVTCGSSGDNNRVDSMEVSDIRPLDLGIDSMVIIGTPDNMQLNLPNFTKCTPIVNFSVSVKDSMFNGSICVRTFDCLTKPAPHYADTCFHYCTIPDKNPPTITIAKDQSRAGLWHICVFDNVPWDRHIDEIFIVGASPSITPTSIPKATTTGLDKYCFDVMSSDTTSASTFCIEATDLGGNRTAKDKYCSAQTISSDTLCPNILFAPPLNTNPSAITVDVNDSHKNPDGSDYVWDSGVDSVWFTNNHGMFVPATIHANGAKTVPTFGIRVRDTLTVDSSACVTVNASDMKGNVCSRTYCYPYEPDTYCPVITLWYNPIDSDIYGRITDSTVYDRGIVSSSLLTPTADDNVSYTQPNTSGVPVQLLSGPNRIIRLNHQKSSQGKLNVFDTHGLSPAGFVGSVDFHVWVQTLALPEGIQPQQNSTFALPVYITQNDNIPVTQKGITEFKLDLTLKGDATSLSRITFLGTGTLNTETATKWTVAYSQPTATTIQVIGKMDVGGTPLSVAKFPDSLVMLNFKAGADQSTRQVTVVVDGVQFNGGRDTIIAGTTCGPKMSTSVMPAPMGSMNGSTIVITGACAPRLQTTNTKPTSVSLDPAHPNPFSKQTTFNYTVASEGQVRFAIYDLLGKEVVRLVDEVQKQGSYTLMFDASKLSGGGYIARLEANGEPHSCPISIQK